MSGTHRPTRTAAHLVCAVLVTLSALLTQVPVPASAAGGSADAASDAAWTRTSARLDGSTPRTVSPRAYAAYALDRGALLAQLDTGLVEVPDPAGRLVAFRVAPTSVMEPELATAHPELRTWGGTAVEGAASIRLDSTPTGVHASVRGDGPAWYVDPAHRGDDRSYLSYAGADLPAPERGLVEPTLPRRTRAQLAAAAARPASLGEGAGAAVTLRTYRLALLSDPTYAHFVSPGAPSNAASDTAVLAAKVTLVNRLDQLYGDDLSIRLQLVTGTDTKLNLWTAAEASGANGPCGQFACFPSSLLAAGCTQPILDREHWVVGQLVGARNFDVGHLVLGIDGGGIAYLDAVGHENKAGGCTGLSAPSGDAYTVDYLAHELGHQFGADHTFDGGAAGCSGNRVADSAVEPGSGSTIMGYAGICGADNLQAHSDPVFSAVSRDAVDAFVRADSFPVFEWQSVAFSQLDGTDSFKLQFGATQTSTITRGVGGTYNAANLKAAVLAALPAGTAVQVKPFFNEGSFDDRGFSLFFTMYGGTFAGDVPEPTVVPVAGTFTSSVNDVDAGNANATSGGATTATGNHNPTVTAPADKTIPVRTPFALTGSATDSDGNALGYVWEQTDTSGSGSGLGLSTEPKTTGPLFRVFGTASSSFANTPTGAGAARSFPDLAQVVAGNTNAVTGACPAGAGRVDCLSEWLPTAAYTGSALHFRLTVRDASAQGGGVDSDDVTLTLDKATGPFRVTSQSNGTTLPGASSPTVTWTTGTSTLAANVRISLSTDGGATFPTVLLAGTPNDGSQAVTLPDLTVAAARLKVEAVGNYFYDVNDASFAIQATGAPAPLVVDRTGLPSSVPAQFSDPVGSLGFSATSGQGVGAISATASGLPPGLTLSAKNVSGQTASWTVSGSPTAAPGSYPVTFTVRDRPAPDPGQAFTATVVVAAEDTTVTYTGPTSVVGPNPDADDVPVTMTAQVSQASDGSPGPLNAATVTFTDTLMDHVLCPGVPVSAAGVATCTFNADLFAVYSVTYHVGLTVGGSFRGHSSSDTTVTVSLPEEVIPVPPETTITSGPSGWLVATTATFGFASSAPGSEFFCRLDGARVPCEAPQVTVTGLGQYAHRFQVYAEDQDGEFDETPAIRDFAVPIDDRGLKASGKWQRKPSSSAYLGTCTQAREKGEALTYPIHDARELALLVRTGKRYGAVKVYLGNELLAKVKTAGKNGSKTILIGHFAEARSGTVRIVTTTARRVLIDGLGVSSRPF